MSAPVEIGQVLAGKYRVERILGVGGMGVVVAAYHLELETLVALKFLLPEILDNSQAIDRFLREARAAVKLKSEHTCQVRDVGRLENGAPYIVMEYLEGHDLNAELLQRGPLPVHEVAGFIVQACKAMVEAHAVGIVHRDLKPQNLFLTRRGDGTPLVKVLDFGIAKLRVQDGSATHTAVIMGSPAYMAPEQARSAKHTDYRADIYSLGVILYQLVSGRLPYPALENTQDLSLTEVLLSVQMDNPTPLRAYHPSLPPGFEDVVMAAMAKDPQYRIQGAAQLSEALMPFLYGQAPAARTTPMPFMAPQAPPSTPPMVAPPVAARPERPVSGPTVQTVHASNTTLSSAAGASLAPTEAPKKKKWVVPMLAAAVVIVGAVSFAAVKASGGGDNAEPTPASEPAKTEPAKPEPAKAEPAKPEPAKPEPAKTEPAKTEPAAKVEEPAKTEPAKVEPAKTEPAKVVTQPKVIKKTTTSKTEPAKTTTKTEPAKTEPAKTEPAKTEPAKTDTKKCRSDDVMCQFGKKGQ